MKKPLAPILLSALVFPGLGQLALKQYFTASVFIFVSVASLYFLVSNTLQRMQPLLDTVNTGASQNEIIQSAQSVLNSAAGSNDTNIAAFIWFLAWAISIIDAYRLGGK